MFDRENDECQHQFVWSTSAACPKSAHQTVSGGTCRIQDVTNHADYDLSMLMKMAQGGYSLEVYAVFFSSFTLLHLYFFY